jgi:succinoglycan biosynthesis transport protein ExoP
MEDVDFRQYWILLRRWFWLIILCALMAGGSAYLITSQQPPVYQASVVLLIHSPANLNQAQLARYIEGESQTYVQMLTERPVIEAALTQVEWDVSFDELKESALPKNRSDTVAYASVGPVRAELIANTRLIQLDVVDTEPERATAFANAIATAFIAQYGEGQRERYADALAAIEIQMSDLAAEMEAIQVQIDALSEQETGAQDNIDLILLQSTLGGYRNTYSTLVRDYEELKAFAAQAADLIEIYVPARVPRFPIPSNILRNTALAAGTGAMLAAGMALLLERLDDTIKTSDDVRRELGLSVLGYIGQLSGEETELVAATQPLSPTSEAFRKLRTSIRFSTLDCPLQTLLITSSGPGEGKSVVAANLSTALAQSGLKVVALDADLRRPRLDRIFGLSLQGGVTKALLDGRVDGYLQQTQKVENLFFLAAGDCPPNPAEALGSRRMRELLAELTQQADMVILDGAPVLPVTDAAVLARSVDAVLLVIDAGKVRRQMAKRAVEDLRQVEANLIGVVLNRMPDSFGGYYHKYYGKRETNTDKRQWRMRDLLNTIRRKRERRAQTRQRFG